MLLVRTLPNSVFPEQTFSKKRDIMNSLDKIFGAMRTGKYVGILDPRGNAHCGLVNGVQREDGSGKNWIVTITNKTTTEKVFIHAN